LLHDQTHNFHLIDTLLDITKTKRTLRSNDIKQFYRLFTENKAESLIFVKVLSR
jgi:CMP-N-acetylneuraminic acid synthetase